MQELLQNNTCVNTKANVFALKTELKNLKQDVEKLSEVISVLNNEVTEYKTKMHYVTNDIKDLKLYYENAKVINETIITLKETINKLEAAFTHHSELSSINFSNIMFDINALKTKLDNMPLLYVSKSTKGISDYIKMAPGIIAILSVLLTILIIYLKSVLAF